MNTIHKKTTQDKDLNIRPKTVKLLEESIQKKLLDFGLGNDFLDTSPKAQATKAKMDKWDYIILKIFCKTKDSQQSTTVKKKKRQPTE